LLLAAPQQVHHGAPISSEDVDAELQQMQQQQMQQ
jgi:hypothetical protein